LQGEKRISQGERKIPKSKTAETLSGIVGCSRGREKDLGESVEGGNSPRNPEKGGSDTEDAGVQSKMVCKGPARDRALLEGKGRRPETSAVICVKSKG